MNYVIKNPRDVFIKLDERGNPVTCCETYKMLFDKEKANNILKSLPKTMKRLNFMLEPVDDDGNIKESPTLKSDDYVPSQNITTWVDKFGLCEDVIEEAIARREVLFREVSSLDKYLSNIMHDIECSKPKNMYGGWQSYHKIRECKRKLRQVKDEILIINNVLRCVNISPLKRSNVQKAIDGLSNRVYKFRFVEEESEVS